nr:uroporphyrinogen-III synthase [Legionella jordanis]
MTKTLNNLRILNTRPKAQAKDLKKAIEAEGGVALDCPALAIQELSFQTPDLNSLEIAIFVSSNAVHYFFKSLRSQNIPWPSSIAIVAVGHATANALLHYNLRSSNIPKGCNSESLLAIELLQQVKEKKILLVKGEGGRTLIAETLVNRRAELISLDVYKRVMPGYDSQYLQTLWQDKAVDIILFTSEQAMYNIFQMFGPSAHSWLCNTPCIVLSQRLAKAASSLGMQRIIISKPEAILETLHQFNQGLIHGKQQ